MEQWEGRLGPWEPGGQLRGIPENSAALFSRYRPTQELAPCTQPHMAALAYASLLLFLAVLVAATTSDTVAVVAPLDGVVRTAMLLLAGAAAVVAVLLGLVKLNVFRRLYWRKMGSVKEAQR